MPGRIPRISVIVLAAALILGASPPGAPSKRTSTAKAPAAKPAPGIAIPEGNLRLTRERRDKWQGLMRDGDAVGVRLDFGTKGPKMLTFILSDVRLRIDGKDHWPRIVALENGSSDVLPRFILQGSKMSSLGITVRNGQAMQDGMMFVAKGEFHFVGHTADPMYLVFDVPQGIADHAANLAFKAEIEKQPFAIDVAVP